MNCSSDKFFNVITYVILIGGEVLIVYFVTGNNFDMQMQRLKEILEVKGYVLESDHPYADSMQYTAAFRDVSTWLQDNGYEGELNTQGHFESGAGAVYGLYDAERISHTRMKCELVKEAKRRAKM